MSQGSQVLLEQLQCVPEHSQCLTTSHGRQEIFHAVLTWEELSTGGPCSYHYEEVEDTKTFLRILTTPPMCSVWINRIYVQGMATLLQNSSKGPVVLHYQYC